MNSRESCFILHAPNIHSGGGLMLLKALLKYMPHKACLIIDERLPISDDELFDFCVYRIKPTLWHRFIAERLLSQLAKPDDEVFCFGNLPPLFKLQAKVALFIQNRHLVEPKLMVGMPLKLRLRLDLERLWLKTFYSNVDNVIVQTPSMKMLASKYASEEVIVAPFLADFVGVTDVSCGDTNKIYDFIYVASGEPHKNHHNLIDALVILSKQGHFPSLCLTVDESQFPQTSCYIEEKKKQYGLKVYNAGCLISNEVLSWYVKASALIFPSTLESFGLPLLEGKRAGLKVIASELDYVRDLLDPEESFDPYSPVSIARSVSRFMNYDEKKACILSAEAFMQKIMENNHGVNR